MDYLPIILFIILILSLSFNYITLSHKTTAIEIVNKMGIGINLGNLFDSYDENIKEIKTPDEQITLYGNVAPTKNMILNIKKNGYRTIRLPITWLYFMDQSGIVNSEWMSRIKEVVKWIINYNMYCIINVHNDGKEGNWLSKGIDSKEKYEILWTQIANEFKDFSEYLIFESMNEVEYILGDSYDYKTLFSLTQSFVDIVRNSGGKNSERLLLISGANADYELTVSDDYIMPIDPANKLAMSIHYYAPYEFTKENCNNSKKTWGDYFDYDEIMTNFYIMRVSFVDKGIPIILGEIGVITEDGKEKESIEEYLYTVFSLSWEFDGVMPCLWDTSNKNTGNMNFYNRETNTWYDEKIYNSLLGVSKGKFVSMWDNFIYTNQEKITYFDEKGNINYYFDDLHLLTITFNVKFVNNASYTDIEIFSFDIFGDEIKIDFGKKNSIKRYDGTFTYLINTTNIECYEYIYSIKSENYENIIFNYFIFEFEEYVSVFDYESYKNQVITNVNSKPK